MVTASSIAVFDRARLRSLRNRRAATMEKFNFLAHWAAGQLADRIQDVTLAFEKALYIGPFPSKIENWGTGKEDAKVKTIFTMDFAEKILPRGNALCADEEFLPFHNSLDLIVSNLAFHATNDLPGVLLQIRRALKPNGLFLAALPGGETLHELRASLTQAEIDLKDGVSPRIFPFADKPQMGALMQRAGFALPVVDSEIVTVTYDNMFHLMHDLRGMAATNIIRERSRIFPGRELFLHAADHYARNFSESDGKIRASFEIIFLIGWAPHDSQQKPLKPGSAKTRLADALGEDEIKL